MQTIMLATDFSERSDRALRRAVLLARETGAHLALIHAVDDDQPRRIVDHATADANTLLSKQVRTLEKVDGMSCSVQVIQSDPFAGIAKAVAESRPDLLVLGPHRRQILKDVFIGTTAERTIRAVDCPVLMVNGPPVGPYLRTLLTTDLPENAPESLQRFEQLKMGINSGLTLVHVFNAPALRLVAMSDTMSQDSQDVYLRDLHNQAQRDLAKCMAMVGGRRPELVARPEKVSIADEILITANDLSSDLIVVSTRGKNVVTRMLLGSVTEQVLRYSPVDVLAIPPIPTQ